MRAAGAQQETQAATAWESRDDAAPGAAAKGHHAQAAGLLLWPRHQRFRFNQGRRTEGGGDVDDRPTNCWQTHDGWSALGGGEAVATDPDPPAGGAPWAATKQRRGGGDGEGGARGSAARAREE